MTPLGGLRLRSLAKGTLIKELFGPTPRAMRSRSFVGDAN